MTERARSGTATKRLVLDIEDAAAFLVGRTLSGRYVLESVLGQGGMGTVYAARHQVIGRPYAVKVLRREIASDHDTVLRFMQEAKIAGGLAHPNIVEVIDFGEVPADELTKFSAPFMVMPLLVGRTMADLLEKEGPLDGARAARLFAQAADGLAAAHDKGVVHRDLKPDNLFVLPDGPRELVKVLDFGVAKLLRAPKLTKHGTVFGTPYYMSPEQAGGREVDPRTDQYALGVVMYEVLSGRVPFDDDTPMGVMTKHLFATPEPLEVVVRDHARLGRMGPIVMRCLEKRRENRFADMRELAAELRVAESGVAVGGVAATAQPSSTTPRGTVRLDGARPRVARTELDLASSSVAALNKKSTGARVAVVAACAVALAGGAFVGYRTFARTTSTAAPSALASAQTAEPSAREPSASPAPIHTPSASIAATANDSAGGPTALSARPTSSGVVLAPPSAARAMPVRPPTPVTVVPTSTSKIDPNVW